MARFRREAGRELLRLFFTLASLVIPKLNKSSAGTSAGVGVAMGQAPLAVTAQTVRYGMGAFSLAIPLLRHFAIRNCPRSPADSGGR